MSGRKRRKTLLASSKKGQVGKRSLVMEPPTDGIVKETYCLYDAIFSEYQEIEALTQDDPETHEREFEDVQVRQVTTDGEFKPENKIRYAKMELNDGNVLITLRPKGYEGYDIPEDEEENDYYIPKDSEEEYSYYVFYPSMKLRNINDLFSRNPAKPKEQPVADKHDSN